MIEDLGESGRLALTFARLAAIELSAPAVGTEHMFLGVAQLEDVNIRDLFAAADVDVEQVRAAIREAAGGKVQRDSGEQIRRPPFTPEAEHALEFARRVAAMVGEDLVEAPHILLGALRDTDGLAASTIKKVSESERGVSRIEQELRRALIQGKWSPRFYRERTAIEQPKVSKTSEVVESLGRDLTLTAARGELSPIIGRERELRELVHVLCGSRKNNAILVGEAGVGKTAIVEGLAQRIVEHEIDKQLDGMQIRTIEVGSLVAGTQYRGMFEERLKTLIDEVRERDDLILFIDEMHMLVGAGRAEGIVMDASDMLKPVLTEGALKVIGATTNDEFGRYIKQDQALMRRFQPIAVGEPSREDTVRILEGLRPRYERFHCVKIEAEALEAAVDLSVRYLGDRYLPDKALDLLDRACTQEKLGIGMQEWMPSLAPPMEERTLDLAVDAEEIAEVVSIMLEIPIATLTADARKRLAGMGEALRKRVIGQNGAIDAVAKALLAAHGMKDAAPECPYGVFLFLGPRGAGKTRLVEEIAAYLFCDRDHVIRLDMAEYGEAHSISSLIGTAPGYAGWEEGGRLTNAVRDKPYSVVLLDEIEKAHPTVGRRLLGMFASGSLTDQAGRAVDFRNTVIVMTTNVGARGTRRIGFTAEGDGGRISSDEIKHEVDTELRALFGQEFLDGIDDQVVLEPLSKEALRQIIGLLIEEMIPMTLELSDAALDLLVDESYDPAIGVRPVRRTIQRLVRNPLSLMLASGEIGEPDTVVAGVENGALTFTRVAQQEADGMWGAGRGHG